jgi:hypothetical protein
MVKGLFLGIAASMLMVLPAGANIFTMSRGYTGSWPLTVSHASRYSDGTWCLTLKDDGDLGWPHSGEATMVDPQGYRFVYGTFRLINHFLVATITAPGGSQNAGLVFAAPARDGIIERQGVYEQVYGGAVTDSGVVMVRMKGGC